MSHGGKFGQFQGVNLPLLGTRGKWAEREDFHNRLDVVDVNA